VSAPRALDAAELPGIVRDYRHAAANAIAAGFDGVEVHAANGYLIDQFLRSSSNHRTDAYGGSVENRARFLQEVMQGIVAEIGGQRTGIRLSPVTPANGGSDDLPQPLFEHVARLLAPMDLAFVHVIEGSTGAARDHQQGDKPFDYAALRQAYSQAGGHGAWMLNNGYDLALADQSLASSADLIAFGRPFIANPDLGARLKQGGPFNTPDRATFYGGGDAGYTDYPCLDQA
jgi:N-ethylmaleimide reductase